MSLFFLLTVYIGYLPVEGAVWAVKIDVFYFRGDSRRVGVSAEALRVLGIERNLNAFL